MPCRGSNFLRPVTSERHETTWSFLSEDASTLKDVTLIKGVISPSGATDVQQGHHVHSIYIEFNLSAETTTEAKVLHWSVIKTRSGQSDPAPNTYDTSQKRSILKRGMEMLVRDQSTLIKRIFVVRLPKSISKFEDGDILHFNYISTSANPQNLCGIAIYRHYG